MRNVSAILRKQIRDTLKNKAVLIQVVMFPVMTLIMNGAIDIDGIPEHFFVTLFAAMYVGMAPLTSMAAIIAEEKEQNTLRVLLMSNVKPYEYLFGTGSYVWGACMLGSMVICISGGYDLRGSITFMGIMAAGIFVSLLVGAVIGTWSRTQMMATSLFVPVMIVFSFLPMLSRFNTTIAKIARFTYTEQISRMLNQVGSGSFRAEYFVVIAMNLLIAAGLFAAAYQKSRLA